jgi:4-carboxymuconolactone decarboxylase
LVLSLENRYARASTSEVFGEEELAMADSDLFEKGLKKRRQVLGERYVDANLAASDDFMMTFQRAVTELAWGYAWSRPGLDQKTRSLLTPGILGGLGRFQELSIYTNAALASGATVDEIKEALVQTGDPRPTFAPA